MVLWHSWWTILLLKVKVGWESFWTFLLKITSLVCLLGSELKQVFHYCAQWLILANSSFISAAELSILCTTENNEVSSASNLVLGYNSLARSFMYIKKKKKKKKKVVLVWNLVGLSVFCSLKDHIISLKACQICPFVLIWKKYLHAILYPTLLIYLGRHF